MKTPFSFVRFKLRPVIVVALALAGAQVGCAAGEPTRFRYVFGQEPYHLDIDPNRVTATARGITLMGHVGHATKFCDDTSDYACFVSLQYTFAVPRRGPLPASWTVKGLTFRRLDSGREVTIAGRRFSDVAVIACPPGLVGNEKRGGSIALYSFEAGLIALADERLVSTFWLADDVGFAARR